MGDQLTFGRGAKPKKPETVMVDEVNRILGDERARAEYADDAEVAYDHFVQLVSFLPDKYHFMNYYNNCLADRLLGYTSNDKIRNTDQVFLRKLSEKITKLPDVKNSEQMVVNTIESEEWQTR